MLLRTLSSRIAAPAGFFALVSVALLSMFLIRSQREQALQEALDGEESIADVIRLSITHEMRANQPKHLQEMLQSVGEQLEIETIRIYNKDGVIAYSSKPAEVGSTIDISSDACAACHSGPVPLDELDPKQRSRVYAGPDGVNLLGTIRVIRNEEGCQGSGCHVPPSRQAVLGVLDVTTSLGAAEQHVAQATLKAVVLSLFAVVFITVALYLIISRSVRQPIDTIVEATRRVAKGDATLPVPPHAAPEIGILAASVNELVERLRSSRFESEAWAGSLEQQLGKTARDLREAQFQVAHAEKLSSVGLVAAGIAHELNSPLMAILTFTHLVKAALPDDTPEQEDLSMIERETNRCAAIIRQLLDFARKQAHEPETQPCDISKVTEGALELLKIELQNSDVEVELSVPEGLPTVEANEIQLMQVFVNLALNAIHAMPDGGRLTIHAEVADRAEHTDDDLPPHQGSRLLRTVVRDTGTGIPAESLHKVFDPFFTTKPVGKGSGLGLSVSLGLVRRYRGTILVDSDGRSGSQFTVLLPIDDEPSEGNQP